MIKQTFDIQMIPGGVPTVVHINQYDNDASALIFRLFNSDGSAFNIPSGSGVLINGTKPDGLGFSYQAVTFSSNTCTFNVTQQMTAVAGDVKTEIRIRNGNNIIGTANFILRVEVGGLVDDTVISATQIPLVEQAMDISAHLAEYISDTKTAAENASKSAEAAALSQRNAANSASQASQSEANTISIYDSIIEARANATQAAERANTIADTLENKLDSGELKGEKGDKGDQGESGVVVTTDSLYGFTVDPNGDFWLWSDVDKSNDFEYNTDTGELYYIISDS